MTIAAAENSNGLAAYGYNTNIQYLGSPHELEQKRPPDGARTGYFNVNTGVGFSTDETQHSGSPISLTVDVVPPFYALCFIMQVPTSSTT
jgi:hypothetical protein